MARNLPYGFSDIMGKFVILQLLSSYALFPNKTKTLRNTGTHRMMELAIHIKIFFGKMPPCVMTLFSGSAHVKCFRLRSYVTHRLTSMGMENIIFSSIEQNSNTYNRQNRLVNIFQSTFE